MFDPGLPQSAQDFQAWIQAARTGSTWALSALWRHFQPALLRYLKVIIPDQAEDIASECWIAAMKSLERFQGDEAAFKGWLFTIARRRSIDFRRKAASRRELLRPEEKIDMPSPVDVESLVMESLGLDESLALLRTLPPAQAEVIALQTIAGFSGAEVAVLLRKQPVAVRVLAHRGMRTLAKNLRAPNTTTWEQQEPLSSPLSDEDFAGNKVRPREVQSIANKR